MAARLLLIACTLMLAGAQVHAQSSGGRVESQSGVIALAGGAASLDLPVDHRYIAGPEARRVLEEMWGNPGDAAVIGLVLTPEQHGAPPWAGIVSWHDVGWIDDRRALPPTEMLLHETRQQARIGSDDVEVTGWALAPSYDHERRVLSWGTRLHFAGDQLENMNVHHALLLRRGFLQLTAVSPVPALETLEQGAARLLSALRVNPGHRHADVAPDDARSPLTLADLVADRHSAPPADTALASVALLWPAAGALALLLALALMLALPRRARGGTTSSSS